MAYFNFSIDDLQDSSTLASAIANNIVPKNGINILATSTASRGYSGQTLTTSDLISSASGKDLLASGVYGNMYRTNMASISLNSLATSALGSENDDMSILDPSNLNEDGSPKIIKQTNKLIKMDLKKLMSGANPQSIMLEQTRGLKGKWEKTGLLEGVGSETQKHGMAVMLENQAKQLLDEATRTGTSSGSEEWAGVALPLVMSYVSLVKKILTLKPWVSAVRSTVSVQI